MLSDVVPGQHSSNLDIGHMDNRKVTGWFLTRPSSPHRWIEGSTYPLLAVSIFSESGPDHHGGLWPVCLKGGNMSLLWVGLQ